MSHPTESMGLTAPQIFISTTYMLGAMLYARHIKWSHTPNGTTLVSKFIFLPSFSFNCLKHNIYLRALFFPPLLINMHIDA